MFRHRCPTRRSPGSAVAADAARGSCDPVHIAEAPDLDEVAALLRERKRELDARSGEFAKAPERGTLLGFGKRIGDGTSEAITRITEAGVGTTLESTAAKIERALVKIDEGTYGVCDSCGREIAPGRLKAAPESVLCVDCAANARRG